MEGAKMGFLGTVSMLLPHLKRFEQFVHKGPNSFWGETDIIVMGN